MSGPPAKIKVMNKTDPQSHLPLAGKPLAGKVALVTGAGRGIGRAVAERLAQAGAAVVCAARSAGQIDEVAASIVAAGGQAVAVEVDVSVRESVDQLVARTIEAFGQLDILVANAGAVHPFQLAGDIDDREWQRMLDVNLSGVHYCCVAAAEALSDGEGGHIVIMGSGQGHRPSEGLAGYCATKAAVAMYARVLGLELRSKGVCVNELVPGPVRTELLAGLVNQPLQALFSDDFQIAGDWVKNPEDVAEYVLFLVSQPTHGASGQRFSMLRRDG